MGGSSKVYGFTVHLLSIFRPPPRPGEESGSYMVKWSRGSDSSKRGLLGPFDSVQDRSDVRIRQGCPATFTFDGTLRPQSGGGFHSKWVRFVVYKATPDGSKGEKLWETQWDASKALPPTSEMQPLLQLCTKDKASVALRVRYRTAVSAPRGGAFACCSSRPTPPPSYPAPGLPPVTPKSSTSHRSTGETASGPLSGDGSKPSSKPKSGLFGGCCSPESKSGSCCARSPPPITRSLIRSPPASGRPLKAVSFAGSGTPRSNLAISPTFLCAASAAPPPDDYSFPAHSPATEDYRFGGSEANGNGVVPPEVGFLVMRAGEDAATEEEGLAIARRQLQQSSAAEGWSDAFSTLSALDTDADHSSSVKVGSLSASKIWKISFSDSSTLMPVIRSQCHDTGYTQSTWDMMYDSGESKGAWCGRRTASWKMSKGKWEGRQVEEDAYFASFRFSGSPLAFLVVHTSQRVKGMPYRVESLYRFIGHSKPSGGHSVRLLITSKLIDPRNKVPEKVLNAVEPLLCAEHDAFLQTFTRRAQDLLLARAGRRGSGGRRRKSQAARKHRVQRAKDKAVRRLSSLGCSHTFSRAVSAKWGSVRVTKKRKVPQTPLDGGINEQRLEDFLWSEKSDRSLGETSLFRGFPAPLADLQLVSSGKTSSLARTTDTPGTTTLRPTFSGSQLRRPSILPAAGCLDDLPQWANIGQHTMRERGGMSRLKTFDDYHEELLQLSRQIESAPRAKIMKEGLTTFQIDRLQRTVAAQPINPARGRPVVLEEALRILKLLTLHGEPSSTSRLAVFCTNLAAVDTILTACEVNERMGQPVAREFTIMLDYIAASKECRLSKCDTPDERRLLTAFGLDPKSADGEVVGVFATTSMVAPFSAKGTLIVTKGYICFLASSREGGRAMVSANDVTVIEGRGGFWKNVVSVHCENRFAGPYDVNQEKVVFRFRFMLGAASKAEVALRSVVPSRPIRFREGSQRG